jgi:hypothetical protein
MNLIEAQSAVPKLVTHTNADDLRRGMRQRRIYPFPTHRHSRRSRSTRRPRCWCSSSRRWRRWSGRPRWPSSGRRRARSNRVKTREADAPAHADESARAGLIGHGAARSGTSNQRVARSGSRIRRHRGSPPGRGRAAAPRRSASGVTPRSTGSLRSRLVAFSHRKIPLHAPFSGGGISVAGNETGPDIRRSVWSRARVHRPGLTVLVALATTVLPAPAYLVAPVAPTAVRDVRQQRDVPCQRMDAVPGPPASCDGGYCPALRRPTTERSEPCNDDVSFG